MKYRFFNGRRAVIVSTVLLVSLAAASGVLAATLTKSGGAVSAVRSATSDEPVYYQDLASTTPVDVAGMTVTVPVPSGERALLIITFSANAQCQRIGGGSAYATCNARAVVDGNVAPPGQVMLLSTTDFQPMQSVSMQWVYGPVKAGTHTIKIQASVGDATNHLYSLGARTLTVLRSKVS